MISVDMKAFNLYAQAYTPTDSDQTKYAVIPHTFIKSSLVFYIIIKQELTPPVIIVPIQWVVFVIHILLARYIRLT